MPKLRVGIVNYLNSKPLAWGFMKGHHADLFAPSYHSPAMVAKLLSQGSLDVGPTELARSYGLTWGVGGFLLTPFLGKLGMEGTMRLRQRVVDELKTTFASHYTNVISLREALDLDTIKAYNRKATGEKYLIDPSR